MRSLLNFHVQVCLNSGINQEAQKFSLSRFQPWCFQSLNLHQERRNQLLLTNQIKRKQQFLLLSIWFQITNLQSQQYKTFFFKKLVTKLPFNLHRIPDVYPEDVKKLKVDPRLPLSYLLQEGNSLQQSICGNIQEGSMLKYHVCL